MTDKRTITVTVNGTYHAFLYIGTPGAGGQMIDLEIHRAESRNASRHPLDAFAQFAIIPVLDAHQDQ